MNRGRPGICASAVAFVAMLAACATKQAADSLPRAPDAAPPEPAPLPDIRSVVEAAVRDAASRLGVDPKTIEVVSASSVTWSDGSLGCPEDGMMYSQALVPGYRVLLRAGGRTLDYHAAANGHAAPCPPERAVDPIPDDRI